MEEKYVYDKDNLSFEKVTVPKIEKKVFGNISYLNLMTYTFWLIIGICLGVMITKRFCVHGIC
jgi:hypothetical protein